MSKSFFEVYAELKDMLIAYRTLSEDSDKKLSELVELVDTGVVENDFDQIDVVLSVSRLLDFIEPRLALHILIREGLREDDEYGTYERDMQEVIGILRVTSDVDMLPILAYLKSDLAFVNVELTTGKFSSEELDVLREEMSHLSVIGSLFGLFS